MIPKFRIYCYETQEMIVARDYRELVELFAGLDADDSLYSDLMQSTGLFDVNGKEIFEGDVVKLVDEYNDSVVSVVTFQNGATGMTADGIFVPFAAMSILSQVEYTLEIIGNIYKNPELMEE
ncbi:TPA: YopX family protein [Streptococcus suis]